MKIVGLYMIVSLAFLVGNGGSLLDLSSLTLYYLHYKSIKQTQNQLTFQTKVKQTILHTHKVMESKSCMGACTR